MTDAAAAWSGLEPPWRTAFQLAWESLCAGSVPVGAVVVDSAGSVVASGRSRAMEPAPVPGQLAHTTVAHAEINALARLPPGPHPDYTVYTTLEPCLMCAGALVVSRIGAVHFAGTDPLWAGIARLPELNPFVAARWPKRSGPFSDPFGALATLLPLLFYLERYPDGGSAAIHRMALPNIRRLGDELVAAGDPRRWRDRTLAVVLDEIWPRLDRAARSEP
ncbi:MAG TPA: nucleoside deaminase [Candidatus Limnocylindria bacterium]|nr:nucleoside deaminase [Candidatus Limnocylindria bacterium]